MDYLYRSHTAVFIGYREGNHLFLLPAVIFAGNLNRWSRLIDAGNTCCYCGSVSCVIRCTDNIIAVFTDSCLICASLCLSRSTCKSNACYTAGCIFVSIRCIGYSPGNGCGFEVCAVSDVWLSNNRSGLI